MPFPSLPKKSAGGWWSSTAEPTEFEMDQFGTTSSSNSSSSATDEPELAFDLDRDLDGGDDDDDGGGDGDGDYGTGGLGMMSSSLFLSKGPGGQEVELQLEVSCARSQFIRQTNTVTPTLIRSACVPACMHIHEAPWRVVPSRSASSVV